MRALTIGLLLASSIATTAAGAAKGGPAPAASLQAALHAMAKPSDPDKGDDHAAEIAIQIVCTKDTPAAENSAICPTPISPD